MAWTGDTRPVFCGNFEYDARPREIEKLFDEYGPVDHIDMKTGYCFVYMKDKRDGDDAIRKLDGREFGYKRRRLRVEWAKGDGEVKKREDERRKNVKPNKTLFVVNFDVQRTSEAEIARHFEEFGRLERVQIKKSFAFVSFENEDMATEALQKCNQTRLGGRVITVEYVANDAPDDRQFIRDRRDDDRGRRRSRSPYNRRSPDYDRRRPSPVYDRRRPSPDYDRRRSPSPYERRGRSRERSYSR